MTEDAERERLQDVYARYDTDSKEQAKRDPANAGLVQIQLERARALRDLLADEGLLPLKGKRVLDIGSGHGHGLARLIAEGADPELSLGVDLLPDRVDKAASLHPPVRFIHADARRLPLDDMAYDLVVANVVFSSILDDEVAAQVAGEMQRVLAPNGAIVWWDNRYPTPGNPHVRGYRRAAIERLFPGCRVHARKTTLLPPLARRLGRAAPMLYRPLALLPVLRCRYLAAVRPSIHGSEED